MFAFQRRTGFALPITILIVATLTAAIAAGFAATTGDIVTNSAQRAQDRAYQLAEAGLQQFLVRRNEAGFCAGCVADPLLADSEYARVSLAGGYADIVSYRVRPRLADTIPAMYFIRARGVDTIIKMSGGGLATFAERSVGQFATWNPGAVKVLGAWASLSGADRTGGRGSITGVDQCGLAGPVAGVVVPSGGQYKPTQVSGAPAPIGSPPVDSSVTEPALETKLGIDWNAIINYNALPADYTDSWPSQLSFDTNPSFWPVIRLTQNDALQRTGRGIIIAVQDFSISGTNSWDGIILVGGELNSSGSNTTSGATISGLELALPANTRVPRAGLHSDDATATGYKNYQYNSCKVASAAKRLRGYIPMSNAWMDNLTAW